MHKYFFETYGCQMNTAESAALVLAARERNWQEAENAESADLVLINTCSVRITAEQRVEGRLSYYGALKKKKAFCLVVAGCMAERIGEQLKNEYPFIDYIIGTHARSSFPLILAALENKSIYIESEQKPLFSFSALHHDESGESPYKSFVPIMQGCDNYCSYCIVPYVRGREISRRPESILNEIKMVAAKGVREITLLGQNVNSYKSGNMDFPRLLESIADIVEKGEAGGLKWIRFLSSHPKDFSPDLITVFNDHSCLCRHIHLCVQHGSNKILTAMNRRYTREQYLELVYKLKSALPELSLSTDILVGFPGESEDDLEDTLNLMEEVKFLYSFMYHFNPREGTAAYSLPDRIDEDVKKSRLSRVIELQKKHTLEILKSRIGKEILVLVEGISRKNADELIGRTERDETVVFPGKSSYMGSFGTLSLSSLKGNTFRAESIKII